MATESQQLDPAPSLLYSIWRYRWPVLAATVLTGLLVAGLSSLRSPSYEATTTMVLQDPAGAGLFDTGSGFIDPERFVPQQANLAESRMVLERAADQVGLSVRQLERQIEIESDVEVASIAITGSAGDATRAAELGNAVADAFETETRQQSVARVEAANEVIQEQVTALREQVRELERRVSRNQNDVAADSRLTTLEGELVALETRASEISANAVVFGSGVQFREVAIPPERPVSPSPLRDGIIAAVLAFGIALGFAYWRSGTTRKVESRADPGEILEVPLLGEIPRLSGASRSAAGGIMPGSEASEAFQFVLSSIEFSLSDIGASSVLVTSASPGDGKTFTALHLALASAREARRVTLVDGDIRVRGLSELLRADGANGLTSMATGEAQLADVRRQYRVSETVQLSFVPAGPAQDDSMGLIRSEGFKQALNTVRSETELAIFDSSPLLPVADASVLASQIDAIVLVVDSNTEREQLQKVRERLAFVSTPLIGYVYNRANVGQSSRYGYGYGPDPTPSGQGTWRQLLTRNATPEPSESNGQAGTRV